MGRIHEVLHWANRRAVAEEVTRRGYRLSGETLNRWVREEKEFPATVERIVFELFGLDTQKEAAPSLTRRLLVGIRALEQKAGVTAEELALAEAALEMDQAIARDLATPEQPRGGRKADRAGGQSGASLGSKRSTP